MLSWLFGKKDPKERRREVRIVARHDVSVQVGDRVIKPAHTEDVSPRGMFITAPDVPGMGADVQIIFDDSYSVFGRVVRAVYEPRGFGVQLDRDRCDGPALVSYDALISTGASVE